MPAAQRLAREVSLWVQPELIELLEAAGVGATLLPLHNGVPDVERDLDIEVKMGAMQVFVREPGKRLRLVTGQGDIQCYVPPDTGLVVDARAAIGKIGNAFGFAVETVQRYGAAMTGQQGDGRTEVVLRTGFALDASAAKETVPPTPRELSALADLDPDGTFAAEVSG